MRERSKNKPKSISWSEKADGLLQTYLKKAKSKRGRIFVLSTYGDLILDSGKNSTLDWTSIGSILASVQNAVDQLTKLMGTKNSVFCSGDDNHGFWVESLFGKWILVGVKTAHKPTLLKDLQKHLKAHAPTVSTWNHREALDGMTDQAIDTALTHEMDK